MRHHSRLLFPVWLLFERASQQLWCALSGKQAASSSVVLPRLPTNFTSQWVAMATPPQRTPAGSCACVMQMDKWTEREQAERGSNSLIYPPPPPLPSPPPPGHVISPSPPFPAASSLADPRPKQTAAGLSCHCFPYRPPPFSCFCICLVGWWICHRPPRGGARSCLLSSPKPNQGVFEVAYHR